MLTSIQIAAIIGLLMAFGVDASEVNKIEILLRPPVVQVLGSVPSPTIYQPTYSAPIVSTDTPPVPQTIVTPQVIINQQTPIIMPPQDTTPPKIEMVEINNNTLRILSNEKLGSVEVSVGTLGAATIDGLLQPSKDYFYEYPLSGVDRRGTEVTMKDEAGNAITLHAHDPFL